MLSAVMHLVLQAGVLAGMVVALLALLAAAGGWVVLAFFPRRDAMRWPIFGPIAGMAYFTAVGLPLAKLGLPAGRFAPVLALLGGALTLASGWRLLRSPSGKRVLGTFLRVRGLYCAAIVAVTVVLATYLIVGRTPTSVQTVWGSGDFGAYWITADYLQNHGATLAAYAGQQEYFSAEIADHLGKHARLGCMVYLAAVGALLSPEAIHHIIIPAIVAAMILMLGLAQCWLDRERPGVRGMIVLVAAYPFLYFLLYFTYASQAFGVVLFITGMLLANRAMGAQSRLAIVGATLAGVMIGCALLQYPSMLIVASVFGAVSAVIAVRTRQWAPLAVATAAILVTSGYYLPEIIRELRWAATTPRPPGWDWTALIGSLEFLGFRTVLGYELPKPTPRLLRFADYLLTAAFFALLWLGVRRSRLRAEAVTLVGTTALLAGVALVKYFQHQPNASHAFVKVVSTFAIFVLLVALLPVSHALARFSIRARRLALATLMAVFFLGQFASLRRREPLRPAWYSDDLIVLARRQISQVPVVQFGMELAPIMIAPIVRDERRAAGMRGSGETAPVVLLDRRGLLESHADSVVDRQGEYVALRRAANP